jgi:ribosomal protein S18 acetylase RimI-like enzyme
VAATGQGVARAAGPLVTLAGVSGDDDLRWASLGDADFDDLVRLAAVCLGADGGLPLAAEPGFLRRRWAADGTASRAGRDATGGLVAAAAVRPTTGAGGATVTVLVDPQARPRGYAAELLDWGLAEAARRDGPVTVETESLTAAQADLFASRGLGQVFAEDVMRIDLTLPVPAAVWPSGTTLREWTAGTAPRFFAVYEASFRERPGFPGEPAGTWISDVADDGEFRPGWSVLAEVPGIGDAGFVTGAVGWILQVGVVPGARGKGLGAALIRESLGRMVADGAVEAWLDVNVNNAAIGLYRRLGFRVAGRRARYQRI